jgi:hypothetical protein
MTEEGQIPPPPSFATDTDLDPSSEVDVDLGDEEDQFDLPLPNDGAGAEQVLCRDNLPKGVECVGDYPTVALYLRAQLEDQVSDACQWVLDCLDWSAVQRRWESDGFKLFAESGRVYQIEPQRTAPDRPGPWMPTRGA